MTSDSSAFFRLLQAPPYDTQFKHWTDQQYIILVPPNAEVEYVSSTFGTSQMNLFVKGHVLKESAFFVGQFTSEADKSITEVVEEKLISTPRLLRKTSSNNLLEKKVIKYLKTTKGFKDNFSVGIVQEETFCNDNFKPYKVWHTDKCLHEKHEEIQKASKLIQTVEVVEEKEPQTCEEYRQLLERTNHKLYLVLVKQIDTFNNSYLLLTGYHQQAVQKIHQYYEQIVDEYIQQDTTLENNLPFRLAVNSILLDGIYKKLFPYWIRAFAIEDQTLSDEIQFLKERTMEEFGIPPAFQQNYLPATRLLRSLPTYTTPIEKLRVLVAVTKSILSSVPSTNGVEALTSDELLPILAYIIIQAEVHHLAAEINYMTQFHIEELDMREEGFTLVSFQVALQFLHHESPSVVSNVKSPVKSPSVEDETESLYRAMSMPESYFKMARKSPGLTSPRESIEEMMERRRSLSSDVINSFANRLKEDESEELANIKSKFVQLQPIKEKKTQPNNQLGSLLSSILDE